MSEYDNNQMFQQQASQVVQPQYVQPQPVQPQPMQQVVQTVYAAQGNPEICGDLKKIMASNMMFVAAIIPIVEIICMIIAGIIEDMVGGMIFLTAPFIVMAIELWVTFGTARWSKSGIKTGGLVTGKVFSIIYIVFTGFVIVINLICVVAWSVFASLVGEYLDELMREIFGFGDMYGDFASYSNGIIFVFFLISIIPLVLNIIMNAMLNSFRNILIDAAEDKLMKRPKTMGLAVIMFLVGLPLLLLSVLILWAGFTAGFSTLFMGIAYTLASAMYFYLGVIIIKCGKGK